jgi:starch synthase (maltosyl-transferring)
MDIVSAGWPVDGRRRVIVARVRPSVDGGRHPVKRVRGEDLHVEAELIVDGHDRLDARLLLRHADDPVWLEVAMRPVGADAPDRWCADVELDRLGRWQYRIEAWVDHFATWQDGLGKKLDAGQDVAVDLLAGATLVAAAADRARAHNASRPGDADDAAALDDAARALADDQAPAADRGALAIGGDLAARMARHPDRGHATVSEPPLPLIVERELAGHTAWYELFPRSFGTLRDVADRLPYVAEMGFDVVYLPPVHPIGTTHRKGPNNAPAAAPGDPGSPWAIGGPDGGHDAVHPDLGSLADFGHLVDRADALGLEVAIDVAFQVSPDHPWVAAHPDWFVRRADGTIQHAENPPKKYEDVYPFDFECDDWRGLWQALAGVFLTWAGRGVRIFRVDNPHTKPVGFWAWCLAHVRERYPDAIFLSEAFTRPAMLEQLAKIGFSQSYTYFTWRVGAGELRAYCESLVAAERIEFLRPCFWPNTPDILPEHLQIGGRPAFAQRALLAATLSASWGIYGPAFELCEAAAVPGREEYADSEKYQRRTWDLDREGSLRHLIARLNRIRRAHPALRQDRTLRFHPTTDDGLLCYSKRVGDDVIVCVAGVDPHHRRTGFVELDLAALGVADGQTFQVEDLLGGGRWLWHGARNYVELDPHDAPGHVFAVHRAARREHGFEYYL